jgi:hypothetical protein
VVYIEKHDGTFATDLIDCPGTIAAGTSCLIPRATLSSTFLLVTSDIVYAKIVAVNAVGSSTASNAAGSAVMI